MTAEESPTRAALRELEQSIRDLNLPDVQISRGPDKQSFIVLVPSVHGSHLGLRIDGNAMIEGVNITGTVTREAFAVLSVIEAWRQANEEPVGLFAFTRDEALLLNNALHEMTTGRDEPRSRAMRRALGARLFGFWERTMPGKRAIDRFAFDRAPRLDDGSLAFAIRQEPHSRQVAELLRRWEALRQTVTEQAHKIEDLETDNTQMREYLDGRAEGRDA